LVPAGVSSFVGALFHGERLEQIFFVVALSLAVASVTTGYGRHRKRGVVLLVGAGLLLLGASRWLEGSQSLELLCSLLGACSLVAGHMFNAHALRRLELPGHEARLSGSWTEPPSHHLPAHVTQRPRNWTSATSLRGRAPEAHGVCRQAGDVAAIGAHEMRMLTVLPGRRLRQLVAPDAIAELGADEHAGLSQRKQVSVDGNPIQGAAGEPIGELGMADGRAQVCELPQHLQALTGHAKAVIDEQLPEALFRERSRLGSHQAQPRAFRGSLQVSSPEILSVRGSGVLRALEVRSRRAPAIGSLPELHQPGPCSSAAMRIEPGYPLGYELLMHTVTHKRSLLARVRRVRGQVEAVERALLQERGCAAVVRTIAAARGAMNALASEVLVDHLTDHVLAPQRRRAERAAAGQEISEVIRQFLR